ncbi:MAG: DUF6530 family protein [Armatimonadota bacterium]
MADPVTRVTRETAETVRDYPPPTYLKHQAIFMLPYAPFDGPYAGSTDAKYLSIGRAQWDDDPDAMSAKVWRQPNDKWSRMSEEIPLHRLVDMCILLTKTFYQGQQERAMQPSACIEAGTFENQEQEIDLYRMMDAPKGFFERQNDRIKARLRRLRDELLAANLE